MPEVIALYAEIVESAIEPLPRNWPEVFDWYDNVSWFLLECTILCVAISGPMLFVSAIGSILARRSATRLPRSRFELMTGLVSAGFAMAALAIAFVPLPFHEFEERNVALDFRVIDKASGQPIAGAFVRISNPFDPDWPAPKSLSTNDGRARLTARFPASGEQNAFRASGTFSPWGRWLEASAVHFPTTRIPLQTMIEPNIELDRAGVLRIKLTNGKASEGHFRDLAGVYRIAYHGGTGGQFEIEPDGRFTWRHYTHGSPESQEFGFLKRNGNELELIPVPHSGVEANFPRAAKFQLIECGDRDFLLDLSNEKAVHQFCRASLTGELGAREFDARGGYIRITRVPNSEESFSAWPRIPVKIWMKFLLAELNPKTKDGFLRRALKSVSRRMPSPRPSSPIT
jgi:hypothetical protein